MDKKLYTCACCWFKVFEEVFSEYEICEICNFQDSIWALKKPLIPYFLWGKSFCEEQKEVVKKIPVNTLQINKGRNTYQRNILWKPLNISTFNWRYDYFPRYKFEEFKDKYPQHYEYFEKKCWRHRKIILMIKFTYNALNDIINAKNWNE